LTGTEFAIVVGLTAWATEEQTVRGVILERQPEVPRQRSNLEFRRLLENLPAAAYTCDAKGLITYFNPRAVELWGREPKLNDPVDRY
jgi:PAS domain-containing protein